MTLLELPTIGTPTTVYLANISALWEHAPNLAVQIDTTDELDMLACQPSRNGSVTCQVDGPHGRPIYLHSRYDPQREAEKWADGAQEAAAKLQEGDGDRVPMCYFIDGFGLGYHVKALFDRLAGDAFIVVSEPNAALLRTALEHHDYSDMFASGRLIIITRADRQEIFKKIAPHSREMMLGVIFTRALAQTEDPFHPQVHTLVSEYASYLRAHTISLLNNGIVTCENVLQNLPTYVGTSSVDVVRQRFRGFPAVVVSAGPSLRKNLHTLKQIRDRVVIIAVQTTLKPLLGYGIKPDFVTSLDYHPVSKRFFEGLTRDDLKDIHLIAEPKANWHVIDYYRDKGPISLLGNDFAEGVLKGTDDNHEYLRAGATVAHLAFYLAEYIGADPVMFVGQDLGFTDNVYYSPGNALHAVWRGELNRFSTIEMKEWERIVRNRNILRRTTDIHGQEIYTDEQMFTYLQQFEKDFAACPVTIIDASEGGAQKRFCQTMSLTDAAEKYCTKRIPAELFDYRRDIPEFDAETLTPARECLETRIEETQEMLDLVNGTITIVTEMLELLDDQQALNRKMVRLDELRTMVKHRPDIYKLIMMVSQHAEMYRFRQDRLLEIDDIEGVDRQRRQLQRDVGYVSEIAKGCERLIDMLQHCLDRFDATEPELSNNSTKNANDSRE